MNYNNVNLWFAKDDKDKIVTIEEVNKENGKIYHCPLCGSDLIPRQGDINSWHFAHEDKTKCDGESRIHWWVKNKLIEKGTRFTIEADETREYICKEIFIEQVHKVGELAYKPDITVLTESGETIYFEMAYSNKKKLEDYLDLWIELGNIVVEVDTKTLVESTNKSCLIFKALYYNGKCFNINKSDIYYNMIGLYKEKIMKSQEYIKRKTDIQKLDWLWREINLYKKQQNDEKLNQIIQMIDSIESLEEKEIVYKILVKNKCNQIKDRYEHIKLDYYKEYVKNLVDIPFDYNEFKVVVWTTKNGFNKKTRVAIIRYWGQEAESILTYFPWINKFEYSEYEVESFKCYINNMIYELRDKEYKHSNWKKVRNIINLEVDDRFTLSYDDEKLMCQIYFQDDIFNHDLIMTVNEYRIWDKMNHNQYEYDLGKYFDEKDFLANLLRFKNAIISKIKNNINKWEKELDGFNLFKNKIITLLNKENIKIDDYTTSNKLLSFEYNNQIITMFTEIDFDYCNVKHNKTYEDNHIHIYKSDVEPFLKNETVILYSNSNWSIVSLWGLQREFRELLDINVPNLNNKYVVNLTFRSINEYVYLPRYDFVEFSRKAQQLLSEINKNKYKITDKYVEEQIGRQLIILDNMNYDSVNKAIEDKINKLIYPLICNIKNNKINVRLNCDFTKTSDGKFRPWLIKDFVEVLNQLGINAYNIK